MAWKSFGNGTLCAGSWFSIIGWSLVILSSWFLRYEPVYDKDLIGQEEALRQIKRRRKIRLIPTVTATLWRLFSYVLVVAALSIFYIYDDACENNRVLDSSEWEILAWVTIFVLVYSNKSREMGLWQLLKSTGLVEFLLTIVELIAVLTLTVSFFFMAANYRSELYVSAAFFVVYLAYAIYSTYVAYHLYRFYSARERKLLRETMSLKK